MASLQIAGTIALAASTALPAHAAGAQLKTTLPTADPSPTPPGVVQMPDGGVLYIPQSYHGQKMPFLVVLHGDGSEPLAILKEYQMESENRGIVMLAPRSTESDWDAVLGMRQNSSFSINGHVDFRKDPARIDHDLAAAFQKVAVDTSRVGILGERDGASYAIGIGYANPQIFRTVIAFSPGTPLMQGRADPTQRVFVTASRHDATFVFEDVQETIVGPLGKTKLTFVPYPASGDTPDALKTQALDLFMTPATPYAPG